MERQLDFKVLDTMAFEYLLNVGKISLAFDVRDWKELREDDELKVAYEYYLQRHDFWVNEGKPLSFTDYFIKLTEVYRLQLTIKLLQGRPDAYTNGHITETIDILLEESKQLEGRLGI